MRKIAVLFFAMAMIGGCAGNKTKKPETISQIRVDRQESQLVKQVERNFGNSNCHYNLGKYYQNMALLDKAEYEYNLALGFDPVNRDAQAAMVKTLELAGKTERSQQVAGIYIDQIDVFAEDALLLGRAFQREGLSDYALQCYQKAVVLAPESAALQKQIGYFYLAKGEKIRAEEYFRRSFQLDPYQADVAGELGRMGVVVSIPQKVKKDPLKEMWKKITGVFKPKKKTIENQQQM